MPRTDCEHWFGKFLQGEVQAQIKEGVVVMSGVAELFSNFEMRLPLRRARPSRRQHRDEPFKLAPGFQNEELLLDLHFCDPESVSTQRDNKVVASETLKRLPNRRAAKSRQLAERRFRPDTAGRQLRGYEQLLQRLVGLVAEARQGAAQRGGGRSFDVHQHQFKHIEVRSQPALVPRFRSS